MTRLATLADGGRISAALVEAEIQRLRWLWQRAAPATREQPSGALAGLVDSGTLQTLDLFDRMQLEAVIGICRSARTLSDAGRQLFDQSRTQRNVVNDADRLRKYLQKFGLSWSRITS